MSLNPPPLPPFQPDWGSFQVWWQQAITDIAGAISDLSDQVAALANLNSDDVLTPAKKPVWIFMHSFLTNEQAALDAEATTYGITTEKTAYDTAISSLNAYLATLISTVAWDNLTDNTTITGTILRSKFNDVLVAKQALLNVMHGSAKALASTAQATADTAKKNDKISASATVPSQLLSAVDAGSDASITIAAHTRIYGDNTAVTIGSPATLTGLAYSTTYGVYYDDPTTSTTSPTYHATNILANAMPNFADGRHFVGQVATPAAGGGGTSGGGTPPGGGGPYP